MVDWVEGVVRSLRARRWAQLAVVNLRILLGFGFLPAGLKKVLGQPFTDPASSGPFHDFLDAFIETGAFYGFVGAMQLVAAVLLMTQRFAALGAFVALPILSAIFVFCWSTAVYPTATVVTMMLAGTIGLVSWDLHAWRPLLARDATRAPAAPPPMMELVDLRLWTRAGLAILVFYLSATAIAGEIYRPRGIELDRPAFYLLVAIALVPVITLGLELSARSAGRRR